MRKAKKTEKACVNCTTSHAGKIEAEKLAQIGVTMVVLLAAYELARHFEVFSFASVTEEAVGIGTIFLIGLTAASGSCLAMVGGLLLSLTAAWDEAHPKATRMQKFVPQIHFNLGRILGYIFFGGLTGLIGRSLLLSIKATGFVKVGLSLVMIWLGLSLLGLLPKRYCRLPLPSKITHKFRSLSTSDSIIAPFVLGALTFFVPCGFTQSMQLLALGSGSFQHGALIMGVFALGTLPSLLGIGIVSSIAEGKMAKSFFIVAGCVSILLGFSSLQSGLLLSDIHLLPSLHTQAATTDDPNVRIDENGQQIISVGVTNSGYSAEAFTISPGKPTWIYAEAPDALSGCLNTMTVPAFGMSLPLKKGANWLGPITPTRDFAFMCSMGMFKADVRIRT